MVRPAAKKQFLIEKSVTSQDDQPANGRLGDQFLMPFADEQPNFGVVSW